MFRSSLIVAGAALLCSTALAQSSVVDTAKRFPVTAPLKDAGTVDITTGKWTKPGVSQKALTIIYNNTCTWSGGAFYTGIETCEDFYDEGQVPSSTNADWQTASTNLGGSGSGAADSQPVTAFQFAYCVYNATPPTGIDIEFVFYDNLGGDCVGGIPPTGAGVGGHWSRIFGNAAVGQDAYFDLAGLGLPGSTANGSQACWIVTINTANSGYTMQSDGEGIWDNDDASDKFTWGMRLNTAKPTTSANGFILNADPGYAPFGTCTYDIPCASDVFSGAPCGTGYGNADLFWINVDGGVPGAQCPAGASAGSTCYWFGGYPTSLHAGFWMVVEGDVGPAGAPQFCNSKPSSIPNCTPTLSGPAGPLTKGGALGAVLTGTPAPGGGNPGIVIYSVVGTTGPINTQFGELCISNFFRASAFAKVPGGTIGVCNGTYTFDLQGIVNTQAAIQPGKSLWCQVWYRDPGAAAKANFMNGVGPIVIN